MTSWLAKELWKARVNGTVIASPTERLSLHAAYALQEEIVALSGAKRRGWKVGSTSPEAQARLGTDEPGAGALLDRFFFEDGATVPIHLAHDISIEAEFAFEFGQELMPRAQAYTREEISAAIAAFRPGLEVVGSRFEAGLAGIGRSLITADGGGNVGFVEGPARLDWRDRDLAAHAVTLYLNHETVAEGTGARALGHPLNVLEWLVHHCDRRKIPLKAGDVVTTGTCTGLIAVAPGDKAMADFGALGAVSARFEAAQLQ
jgi:2-keto-4-pentenoate hydratase